MASQQTSTTPMKGSRNPRRQPQQPQQRKNHTPVSQGRAVMLSTPPSSPPPITSPGDSFAEGTAEVYNGDHNGSRKKNGTRSNKKSRENARLNNNTAHGNGVSHRHTSSQPNVASPPPLKDSPHYAGPTFHASPAPSTLPMPTFFSKSVPDSGLAASLEPEDELDEDSALELTPSKTKAVRNCTNQEPSPLDFLFKAAINARGKAQLSPEIVPKTATSSTPGQRPEHSANGIFSLELDGSDKNAPAYSTPVSSYKDKMNALTSGGHQHHAKLELDEAQRKLKTEELKHLLLNPRPQRPSTASPHLKHHPHSFTQTNGLRYTANPTLHVSSGPPTPVSFNGRPHQATMVAPGKENVFNSPGQPLVQTNFSPAFHRGQSPYASPSNAHSYGPQFSQSPFRGAHNPHGYQTPTPSNMKSHHTPATRPPEPDTKKMEDDLRRILKLDLTTGIQSSGVQSSIV